MANTGSFNTAAYEVRYLIFEWSLESQSVSENSSTISWSLKGAGGSKDKYYYTGNFSVVIDGETVYQSKPSIQLKHQTVASGKKTIYHNTDGTRTFSASASAGIYYSGSSNSKGSGSWDLTSIPRKAVLTSAPSFNDEEDPTIYYSNPVGSSASSVEACISFTGKKDDIAYRTISKTGTSYTFHLTEAERNILRNGTTTSNSRTVWFYVRTILNGNSYTNYLGKTLTIVNAEPTLNPTAYDSNAESTKVTGDSNKLIVGISNATVSCGAEAHKGATIVSQKITNGGQVINSCSGTFNSIDSGDFVFSVTDSRGNVTSKKLSKICYPYTHASVSITGTKLSADGKLTLSFTGNLYNGSFGKTEGNDNKHYAYYQIKEQGGEWSKWNSISNYIKIGNYQTYTVDAPISGLDYTKTYAVKAAIEDYFTWKETKEVIVVSKPIFDWGKDDFNFNCSTISGPLYSLGGIPESNFIPQYSDFNDYKKPGIYCVAQSAYMPTMKNAPKTDAGRLICIASLGDADNEGIWSYLIQRFIPYTSKGSWKRIASTGSDPNKWSWGEWVLELNSNDTDYIVAQGQSGIWNYRKWNSGKAECWGSKTVSGSMTGWHETSYGCMTRLNYPFTFVGAPHEIVTAHSSNGVWLYQEGWNSTTQTGNYGIMRPAGSPLSSVNVGFHYYVFGDWK